MENNRDVASSQLFPPLCYGIPMRQHEREYLSKLGCRYAVLQHGETSNCGLLEIFLLQYHYPSASEARIQPAG